MRVSNQMGGNRLYKSTKQNKQRKVAAQARQEARKGFIRSSGLTGSGALRSSLYNDMFGQSIKTQHDALRLMRTNYRKASQLMKQEKYKPLKGDKDVWTSFINGEINEKGLDEALKKLKEEAEKKVTEEADKKVPDEADEKVKDEADKKVTAPEA